MTATIDHLVYTVPDLEAAMDDLEKRLGVRPVVGGRHLDRGTKNALIRLDKGAYLEILAADEENDAVRHRRWMGVDVLTGPKLTRWALRVEDLERSAVLLQTYDPRHGRIVAGSRALASGGELRWRMTLPLAEPEIDVVPFCIDWSETEVEPFDALPDTGCSLDSFLICAPAPLRTRSRPMKLVKLLDELGASVAVTPESTWLEATIRCPNGLVRL